MMETFLIFAGGAAGSIIRYILGKQISRKTKSSIPVGTFLINISGAFLLGIVSALDPDKNLYLLAAEGFLGGYTTFSTFMYEGFSLISTGRKINAIIYISGTVITGILGFGLGFTII